MRMITFNMVVIHISGILSDGANKKELQRMDSPDMDGMSYLLIYFVDLFIYLFIYFTLLLFTIR